MTRFKESFVKLSEHESPHKVKLGDDYQYPIKGSGESSYKIDSGKSIKMKDVLFVISTSSGENMTFLGDPVWVIWYIDRRLEARPGTYSTLLN